MIKVIGNLTATQLQIHLNRINENNIISILSCPYGYECMQQRYTIICRTTDPEAFGRAFE